MVLLRTVAVVLGLGIAATGRTYGSPQWTSYRGPGDQGHCDAATDPPIHWSESENVSWKTPLAGKAWSSPVIWDDRIWLTDANQEGTKLFVVCADKNSGTIILHKQLREVAQPQDCHTFNSYASPSPVIEEGRVYVSFGAVCTACLDSKTGEVIWRREDFVCNHFRGAGSSPLIYGDLLIMHFDGSDHQYVVALDKRTGKTVWKTDRSIEYHDLDPKTGGPFNDGDLRKAFSTPLVVDVNGQPVLVSLGSMALYGYDPGTGQELWRVEFSGHHSGVCRPVFGHGLLFTVTGHNGEIWAVRPDGRGDVSDSHVAWKYGRKSGRRSSFLSVDDWLFAIDAAGVAACLEASSGKEIWKARVGGNHSASPIYCRGKIYFFDESGKTTIIEAAAQYKVIAENRLADGFMASPAVSGNALYLRTRSALYRIEAPGRTFPAASQ